MDDVREIVDERVMGGYLKWGTGHTTKLETLGYIATSKSGEQRSEKGRRGTRAHESR